MDELDVLIGRNGNATTLTPLTLRAQEWVYENVFDKQYRQCLIGRAITFDAKRAIDVVSRMAAAGLRV